MESEKGTRTVDHLFVVVIIVSIALETLVSVGQVLVVYVVSTFCHPTADWPSAVLQLKVCFCWVRICKDTFTII